MPPEPTGFAPARPLSEAVAVPDPAGPPSPADYPVRLEIAYPAELNRWLPLVKWLLVDPALHRAVLRRHRRVLRRRSSRSSPCCSPAAGRAARSITSPARSAGRYRVVAYLHLMTDAYPPFSLADDPAYPVRLQIEYPEHDRELAPARPVAAGDPVPDRRRLALLADGASVTIVAFFTILFTKQIPRGMFELMMPGLRWNLRGKRLRLLHGGPLPAVGVGLEHRLEFPGACPHPGAAAGSGGLRGRPARPRRGVSPRSGRGDRGRRDPLDRPDRDDPATGARRRVASPRRPATDCEYAKACGGTSATRKRS